ncbi:LpqB family beta-propeller domain-containing protein [Ammonicoccus fulvus]|uniref:LpqB family beta-propeller domain-containing protein n=1 Tax=Ammonicoccus fulvus TaxID=3138240 RepID=A0ABZ3FMF4_9ACTN
MRISTRRGVRRLVLLMALALLVLSGCTRIPTSGTVESAEGPTKVPEVSVEVAPEPPTPGASPRMVVEGYLQAMANYQQGYGVARLYLSSAVRESWRPETGVTVYEDGYGVSATPEVATLEAPLVGTIEADGSFRHRTDPLIHDFHLVRDTDGEWRIGNPPEGLLISRYLFDKFYASVNLWFFDPSWTTMVPDPVLVPTGNRTPTALLQGLLRGPTDWLSPVVVSAIPSQTRLNVQSAYADADGVVEVSLSESVAALADEQRSRMAAQVVWTLGQLDGVSGVRFHMNGAPYAIPEANEGVVDIRAFEWLDRTPAGGRPPAVFGATEAGLVTMAEGAGNTEIQPVAGPMGELAGVTSFDVAPGRDRVAVVTDHGHALRLGALTDSPPEVLSARGLLRPQFVQSQTSEVWTIGDLDPPAEPGAVASQTVVRIAPDRTDHLALPVMESRVLAFRLSPDGTRMALIRTTPEGRRELGVARVNRSLPDIVLDGWRPVPLGDANDPGPTLVVDVGWLDPTTLIVLAGAGDRQPVKPYRVGVYATSVTEIGQPDNWQAETVATAPRTGGGRALVQGRNGIWRYEDDYRWPLAGKGLIAVAYAS